MHSWRRRRQPYRPYRRYRRYSNEDVSCVPRRLGDAVPSDAVRLFCSGGGEHSAEEHQGCLVEEHL